MRATQLRIALIVGMIVVVLTATLGNVAGRTHRPRLTPIVANGSWPVYHRDNARTGNDPTLPPLSSVSTGWTSAILDGQIYASPVVYGGVVYTATLNNSVYALNQSDGSLVWGPIHLRNPEARANDTTGVNGPVCGNVRPQGILGTPAIDPAGGRIYVVTLSGVDDHYRVEGLNLVTGVEELNTDISAFIGASFEWRIQQQRGALAIANGYVYVPFGGRSGDCFLPNGTPNPTPYYGWVVGVPTSGSTSLNVFQTPSGAESVWAPGGVVLDDSSHNVFFATGNAIPCPGSTLSDAVVRLTPTLTTPDFFEPNDWQSSWCNPDSDLGSASPVLISPNLMFTAGKHGGGFLLDPTNLGGVDGQLFPTPMPATYAQANVCFGNTFGATFGSFAYAAPFVYLECESRGLVALRLNTSAPSFSPCNAACAAPDWHAGGTNTFGPPIVAAGAVWVASNIGLMAFRASDGTLLYQSAAFGINRFVTPAEAGGQVFVPSHTVIRSFVMHFGVRQSSPAPSPPLRSTPISQSSPQPTATRPPVSQSSPIPTPTGR